MQGILYVVGTPIGNLGDMSSRARDTLESVDFIAAEDTRVTLKLLNHFGIKKPLESYFEHNKNQKGPEIVKRILDGENCALVTDAGMPAISDPGAELVALCAENGVCVLAVPGPCAAVTALAVSGLPSGRFCFEGFLSVNKKLRREHLAEITQETRTLIFYEAPHKLKQTLADLYEALGDRRVALVRELTKIHEETQRTTLSSAVEFYSANDPRGEYVLIVEGKTVEDVESPEPDENRLKRAAELAAEYMSSGGLNRAQAVKKAAREANVPRAELYKLTL